MRVLTPTNVTRNLVTINYYSIYYGIYKGSFNKDVRFLNVNKTSCVWDIHSIFFYLKEYFMALSMEYNVAQMSATASLGNIYSGGPIFDDFLA